MNKEAKENCNFRNSQSYIHACNPQSSYKENNSIKKIRTQKHKRKLQCSSNKNVLREVQLNHIGRSCKNLPSNSIGAEMYKENVDKSYECQIQYLNKILQNPLNHVPLTQEELKRLFIKYKMDGHYRINTDLPAFSTFVNNTDDATDTDSHYSDHTEWQNHINYCETSYQNDSIISENLYYNNAQNSPQTIEQNKGMHKDWQYLQYESQVLSNNNHEPHMAQNMLCDLEQNDVKEYNSSCMFSDTQISDHLEHMFITNSVANIEKQESFEYPYHYSNITDLTDKDTFEKDQLNERNMIPMNSGLTDSNSFYDAEVNNGDSFINMNNSTLNRPENMDVKCFDDIQPNDARDWQSYMNNNYNNTNVNIAPHFMDISYSNNYSEVESSFKTHDNMNIYQYAINDSSAMQHNYSNNYSVMQGTFNNTSYENMYGSTISTAL